MLGRGAYSKILQVYDPSTGSMFAMKVLRKAALVQAAHYAHVLLEQSILSRMEHPFVCRLYYAFQSPDKLYMVMSYAAGGDVFTLLRRRPLTEADVAPLRRRAHPGPALPAPAPHHTPRREA